MLAGLNFAALAQLLVQIKVGTVGAEVAYAGAQPGKQVDC